jgi:hypothetical protein
VVDLLQVRAAALKEELEKVEDSLVLIDDRVVVRRLTCAKALAFQLSQESPPITSHLASSDTAIHLSSTIDEALEALQR